MTFTDRRAVVNRAGSAVEYKSSREIAKDEQPDWGANARHMPEALARPGRVRLTGWGVAAAFGVAGILLGSRAVGGQEQQEDRGRQEYTNAGCAACHGPSAQGGTASALAGTTRSFSEFLTIVREGMDEMAPVSESEVSDEQLAIIHKWLAQVPSKRTGRKGMTHAR